MWKVSQVCFSHSISNSLTSSYQKNFYLCKGNFMGTFFFFFLLMKVCFFCKELVPTMNILILLETIIKIQILVESQGPQMKLGIFMQRWNLLAIFSNGSHGICQTTWMAMSCFLIFLFTFLFSSSWLPMQHRYILYSNLTYKI